MIGHDGDEVKGLRRTSGGRRGGRESKTAKRQQAQRRGRRRTRIKGRGRRRKGGGKSTTTTMTIMERGRDLSAGTIDDQIVTKENDRKEEKGKEIKRGGAEGWTGTCHTVSRLTKLAAKLRQLSFILSSGSRGAKRN